MASERLVSPGVFTRENDLSFLPQGIAEIGAAFVGPTVSGPAFVPTIVESPQEFQQIFGVPTPEYYIGYAATDYLGDAARATIVRVLGTTGYELDSNDSTSGVALTASGTGGDFLSVLIWPSRNTNGVSDLSIVTASIDGGNSSSTAFDLTLVDSAGGSSSFTGLSLEPTSANYIGNALGSSPNSAEVGYSLIIMSDAAYNAAQSTGSLTGVEVAIQSGSAVTTAYDFSGSTNGRYDGAETPWVQSQTLAGKHNDLFKVHTFADGNDSNRSVKISIASVRPAPSNAESQYGTFSLIVRQFDDTDSRLSVVESFSNLTMDPDSPDFIARRIGDQYWTLDASDELVQLGDYPNNSKYIYIEMGAGSDSFPENALPTGYGLLSEVVDVSALAGSILLTSGSQVTTRYVVPTGGGTSVENVRTYYGFDFSNTSNLGFLNPVPANASLLAGTDFNLEDLTGDDLDVAQGVISGSTTNTDLRKFSVPLQRGFDGLNPSRVLATGGDITANNTQGFDISDADSSGGKAYKRAIDSISNAEAWDINLLVVPGVLRELHAYVTGLAITMCEDRADCFYIMDGFQFGSTVDNAINTVVDLDTNYAGVYHPWVKILDTNTNKRIWVPPSTVMPAVYAFNDKVAAEWFAPAGLNRGGITVAAQVEKRLTQTDRDNLYEGKINPIALFPGQGVAAFGQKTLQTRASALDRINVRRLLIAVKKFIASSARYLVFEQNVEATRQRFLNIANPYLASIQERSGLYAFRVVMDESNNPPDVIDRNLLVGEIYLQPTRTAEFITLEFNIQPTGATFPS